MLRRYSMFSSEKVPPRRRSQTPVKADSNARAKTIHQLQKPLCRCNTPPANSTNASISDVHSLSRNPMSADGKRLIAVIPRQINRCHGRRRDLHASSGLQFGHYHQELRIRCVFRQILALEAQVLIDEFIALTPRVQLRDIFLLMIGAIAEIVIVVPLQMFGPSRFLTISVSVMVGGVWWIVGYQR